jgi:hypothetical protein
MDDRYVSAAIERELMIGRVMFVLALTFAAAGVELRGIQVCEGAR